jgi:histidinol-phosphate aminotransferase
MKPKPGIFDIAPYSPGKAEAEGFAQPLKLSANENPLGCSEAARAAFIDAASEIHRYPDSRTSRLRAAVAAKYNLEPERLVFGAGSDEIFAMACQAYLGEGYAMVQPQFAFAAWAIAARSVGARVVSAPERDYAVDVDAMLAAVDERTRAMFIANPANPTGTYIPFSEIERLHAALPRDVLLVIDGAYAECAGDIDDFSDGLNWSRDKDNVLVTRTFSKIYGLASLRVGWAHGPTDVIEVLDRIRLPFSVTRTGEAAAVAALADTAFVRRSVELVTSERERLALTLAALGCQVLPSAANFVTARFTSPSAAEVERKLAERGILVRGLTNYGLPDWLRITVGTQQQNDELIEAINLLVDAPQHRSVERKQTRGWKDD